MHATRACAGEVPFEWPQGTFPYVIRLRVTGSLALRN